MNLDVLKYTCEGQTVLSCLQIRIFHERTLISSYSTQDEIPTLDLTEPYHENLFDTDELINYCVTSDLLIIGYIHVRQSPYSVVIGPARLLEVTETIVRRIILSGVYPLKLTQIPELKMYLTDLPYMDIKMFMYILSLMNAHINQVINEPKDIFKYEPEYDISKEVNHHMLLKDEQTFFHGIRRRNSQSAEADLLFIIKHGLTSQMKEYDSKHTTIDMGILGQDNLRHIKNSMIILNSLSLRAAISGGVCPETCYQLGEIYIQKIEACKNINQLTALSNTIRLDYCERVRELHHPMTEDTIINRAVLYINENIHKRLTVKQIADYLSLSPNYFSARFKAVIGSTVIDYINQERIIEAKRLLLLTNKSLSEISEYLTFSTQSHFQNTFRKYEGMTPNCYRKSKSRADLIL